MTSWKFFAVSSAFFAALTAIFGKLGVQEMNSNMATLIRTFFILIILVALVWVRGEWEIPREVNFKSWIFLFLSASCTGVSWICYYRALQLGPASQVAPVDKMSLALTILLSVVILGEALSWKIAIAGAMILGGSLLILL